MMEGIDSNTLLLAFILISGLYMAWNIGANDVANAMGTSVGSGALTLRQAVLIAAVLEFSGAFFFGSHVSETVQRKIIDPEIFSNNPTILIYGMLSCLLASGAWLQIASYFGWPVSTTHSIIGALVGFGAVVGGWSAIQWENVGYILSSWVLSPIFGGIISFLLFGFLRKQIFYAKNPVLQAKKLAPILVFFVMAILSLILFFKGFGNVLPNLSALEAVLLSVSVGAVSSLVSLYFVRKVDVREVKHNPETLENLQVLQGLGKVKKHLLKAQEASVGQARYRLRSMLQEVDDLTASIEPEEERRDHHEDFLKVESLFGYLQILSACMMAFAHGANDVANAIGPIAAALEALGEIPEGSTTVPSWLLALGGIGIIVGLATWGWRVIETIGKKITELTPTRGFAAEFGAALTILVASRLGMPISTTHTLVGSVIGVGLARGIEALDLSTTRDIFISWIVTVPAGALLAVGISYILSATLG